MEGQKKNQKSKPPRHPKPSKKSTGNVKGNPIHHEPLETKQKAK
jgi:hypothetical protein